MNPRATAHIVWTILFTLHIIFSNGELCTLLDGPGPFSLFKYFEKGVLEFRRKQLLQQLVIVVVVLGS